MITARRRHIILYRLKFEWKFKTFVGSITMVKASVVVLGKAPATGAKLTVDIFEVTEVELPELADGELLIRVLYASVDPCV